PGGLDAVASQVRDASAHVGFFYLAGHGVPDQIVDAAFAASREFHAMPLDEKLALRINENNIGYLAPNQSIQGASTIHKATRPNYNESFFISHDRGPEHPDVLAGASLRGRNQWPEGHAGMRAAMIIYFQTLEQGGGGAGIVIRLQAPGGGGGPIAPRLPFRPHLPRRSLPPVL